MFLTTCIIIPARSYFVNAFFEFFQNYLYKFPAGSCIRILGRRAVRLELPPHLFRRVSGAGRPARMDPRPAGRAERPEHRVQRQTIHPVRDQPDAACQRWYSALVTMQNSKNGFVLFTTVTSTVDCALRLPTSETIVFACRVTISRPADPADRRTGTAQDRTGGPC